MGLPDSDRVSVPRRTQEHCGSLFGFVYRTVTFYGLTFQKVLLPNKFITSICKSYNPAAIKTTVWADPLSLATTQGIISFPRVTKMFQFTPFPLLPYVFR